jgi:hypothetical protein
MKEAVSKPAESLRVLLRDLIDYAGLFPPAGLDMNTAVANYARYLRGEYSWMLGRFVLPAPRLAEFEAAMPENQPQPWRLSVLIGPKLENDIAALEAFAPRCSKLAVIDCIETKVSTPDDIKKAHHLIGSATTTYYETPLTPQLPILLDAIKAVNGRAKIRTGGVTPDAFPSSEAIANFLLACAERSLPFKATAGLHHPLRCTKPLTYETNAPSGTMHGFLNLFMCAAFLRRQSKPKHLDLVSKILSAERPELSFDNEQASMRVNGAAAPTDSWVGDPKATGSGHFGLPTEYIRSARANFAISFGSCSFEEPIADLKALNLL